MTSDMNRQPQDMLEWDITQFYSDRHKRSLLFVLPWIDWAQVWLGQLPSA